MKHSQVAQIQLNGENPHFLYFKVIVWGQQFQYKVSFLSNLKKNIYTKLLHL